MANWAGVSAALVALVRPSTLQPRLIVPSIANLDWSQLRARGVQGIVIDKDNCITKPNQDDLAPDPAIRQAWADLLLEFGPDNVLIVSNSAGTLRKDPVLLQAESVSRKLKVPVLVHKSPKPGHPCVKQIAAHFLRSPSSPSCASLSLFPSKGRSQIVYSPLAKALAPPAPPIPANPRDPQVLRLLVIGDRLATDMILSHRLSQLSLPLPPPRVPFSMLSLFRRTPAPPSNPSPVNRIDPIAVLTTQLHAREGLGTTLMRAMEKAALWALERRSRRIGGVEAAQKEGESWEECVKGYTPPPAVVKAVEAAPEATLPDVAPSSSTTPPAPSPAPSHSLAHITSLPSLATLATLQSLPSSLLSEIRALPAALALRARALPSSLLASLRSLARRLGSRAEASLPLLLARLHAPLTRLLQIYTKPETLAPAPSFASEKNEKRLTGPKEQWRSIWSASEGAVGAAERVVNRVEGVMEGVKRRVESR
ncbi:hypothetical protein JCM1841_005531 [Sporobolomyces salmonicolor]